MDFETMGNHCLFVFIGESSFQGFVGAGFRSSTVCLEVTRLLHVHLANHKEDVETRSLTFNF